MSAFLDLGVNANAKSRMCVCFVHVSFSRSTNALMFSGDSPLHYAAREGALGAATLLLDRGARVNELGYESA